MYRLLWIGMVRETFVTKCRHKVDSERGIVFKDWKGRRDSKDVVDQVILGGPVGIASLI